MNPLARFFDANAARAEARECREKYDRMVEQYRFALTRVEAADSREAALQVALAQAREYGDRVGLERDEARREVDEVRAGLAFLEGQFFRTGTE